MLDDFLIRAALAGIALTFATGPLGAFVVWRRMAYFGDATAHAAILGVALALSFQFSIFIGTIATSFLMAFTVIRMQKSTLASDTILGVLAHSALALGIVLASKITTIRVDLMAFLFGDILAVSKADLALIWGGSLAVCLLLLTRWSALLTATLDRDLAVASGLNPSRDETILVLAMALSVAVAVKIVGALLITAMLIIPAASARIFAKTPEFMALSATLLGMISVLAGLGLAYYADLPAGPSMIVTSSALFLTLRLSQYFRGYFA